MSSTSLIPQNYTPKSFWNKPEGKPGMFLTVVGGLAALVGFYFALPFLLGIVWGAVNLAIGAGILFGLGYVVFNPRIRNLASNIFQSVCRAIAWTYTTIDPIGILQNNINQMKDARRELQGTIERFAGSLQNLRNNISKNGAEIMALKAKADLAANASGTERDPIKAQSYRYKKENAEQKAGMLMQSNTTLQSLEGQTDTMLTQFRHLGVVTDAKIERCEMQRDVLKQQRTIILDAKETLGIGRRLLSPKSAQEEQNNMALEYLAEDAARTVGEINEFNDTTDKLLMDLDLENGANAALARQKFAEMGNKITASTRQESPEVLQLAQQNASSAGIPFAPATSVEDNEYAQVFRK